MAELTPLGFRKPDGKSRVRDGDNDIAANAQRSQELLTESRARLANLEAESMDLGLDGGSASTVFTGDVFEGGTASSLFDAAPETPGRLELNDSAVAQAVSAGPETTAHLDGTYAPLTGSTEYATPAEISAEVAASRAEIERRYPATQGAGRVTVGNARVSTGVDTRYSAFPVQTKLNDARILMVWYEATDHITTRDGIVVGSYSADNGRTWGPKLTFQSQPGIDLRDPTVSTSSDGATLYLTYIKCTAAKPRDGFFLRRSLDNGATWGPEIRIDPVGSNGAGTAPLVEMADGRLIAVWFGMLTGEAYDSSWRAYSSDDGLTWSTPERFRNGVADSRGYPEPYAAVYGNNVVIMYRHGEIDQLGIIRSTNNGGSWSVPTALWAGTGRPSCTITSAGTLIVVYRDYPGGLDDQHAVMRYSRDLGLTWTYPRIVERAADRWMVYSCPTEIAPGVVMCSTGIEVSTTSAVLSVRYLLEGAGISPLGDTAPRPEQIAIGRLSNIATVDSFDRADSSSVGRSDNGQYWSSFAGPQIKDGALEYSGSAGPFLVMTKILAPSQEVEAELLWSSNSGVALVFRYENAANYWMVSIETAGDNVRLYKVVAGAATQVATAGVSAPSGQFHKVKVSALGDNIRVFLEDIPLYSATDSTHASTGIWAGVRVGSDSVSCTHRVRNFISRRRSGRLA
ncbi:sialidase family protein [Arthrobacter sp. SAFR-014]|uniref:sialidase family protein n=1 Tax=unclassified Arthrobacter TaxID=235627 RepID=UPI003F7B39CF